MDKVRLGRRLAEARELAGMTQDAVARELKLDRAAISHLERGDRNLRVPELVTLAQLLGRPLSYFVEPPVQAAVNRRAAPHADHDSTLGLDVEVDQFAGEVRTLLAMGLLTSADRDPAARTPRTHAEAERVAAKFRREAGMGDGPVKDLGRVCEVFGLYTWAPALGRSGPDGACVQVDSEGRVAGATVVNGDADSGRRRMTLAHELGHWLFGDAYDSQAGFDAEMWIDSFAIHFLGPRTGVTNMWRAHSQLSTRDRALAVGVEFRLSWTAVIGQLRNLDLITREEREQLASDEPRRGDYLRLGLSWSDELTAPYLSPGYVAACLNGYAAGVLTPARTLELLHGLLTIDDLPQPLDDKQRLRRAFEGHEALTR
ncbi:helix-turn-helix domain-containing protein [Nakamurella sp. YIM 132087]|uniref:Helix-turn-helix domain-containing protein n=1 Tax=Nakamurella alba TaxID=2665158 RepID=A0A7K1FMX0_9ACTN|nr:XRE family transcriptional regulator [Nakamurella alba]MTD15430.1 helix-turn-helix domain-containing protein [Nakamurella alba]